MRGARPPPAGRRRTRPTPRQLAAGRRRAARPCSSASGGRVAGCVLRVEPALHRGANLLVQPALEAAGPNLLQPLLLQLAALARLQQLVDGEACLAGIERVADLAHV